MRLYRDGFLMMLFAFALLFAVLGGVRAQEPGIDDEPIRSCDISIVLEDAEKKKPFYKTAAEFVGPVALWIAHELVYEHGALPHVLIVSWTSYFTIYVCQPDGTWFWRNLRADLQAHGYAPKQFPVVGGWQ